MAAARFLVCGRVQGVYFRAATRERALALGLDGQALNLADGRVDVVAAGETAALEALAEWLQHGPPTARVERVLRQSWPEPVAAGFAIG
ncbi:acylphosphatase [Xanthomonas hyacinthi]|uniref:acylphosphatase n=1 Tax=Xanthomonas hyacinthi TaxID=56455 RepID=A0A2S7F2X0_9XANT|nr:acylphosphatase [Xanthomonas hyacinthi]KLD75253.1 acylphosphatase [Xanthomonas hyacinthi DSM 19077]PPU99728.1 acylphosphatase [Xanthomonas hyacinthi]QGY75876.1 acylphosphatase [Xanthomonas hyacinthi]